MAITPDQQQWPEPMHPFRRAFGATLAGFANGMLIEGMIQTFDDRRPFVFTCFDCYS